MTDPKQPLIVEDVPAVYHINDLTLYFADDPKNPNLYAIRDLKTDKHYIFPHSLKTNTKTQGYENAVLEFRIPILTNLKDNFYKKYR